MVTHYSKQSWHSWKEVNEIYTDIYHGKSITTLYAIIEINTDKIVASTKVYKKAQKIVLPENYEVSAHALVKEMRYFKQQYEELNLDDLPDLQNEAKKDPHQMLNVIWGRLGARSKS